MQKRISNNNNNFFVDFCMCFFVAHRHGRFLPGEQILEYYISSVVVLLVLFFQRTLPEKIMDHLHSATITSSTSIPLVLHLLPLIDRLLLSLLHPPPLVVSIPPSGYNTEGGDLGEGTLSYIFGSKSQERR